MSHRAAKSQSAKHRPDRQSTLPIAATKPTSALIIWTLALAVFIIVFVTFMPALKNGFVDWDDTDNFLRNTDYRGMGPDNIQWMFTTFYMGHYQPLTWLTLGLDASCGEVLFHDRLDPHPYHLTNNLLHSLNAVLVFLIALRLIGWRRANDQVRPLPPQALLGGAAVAALLFGVHPLRVESVAWLSERRDLLSGFFILLTVLAYLRANEPPRAK